MTTKWEVVDDLAPQEGPPRPTSCEAGPTSHPWKFTFSAVNGWTITTDCPWCADTALLSDWPSEYLEIEVEVTLEPHLERYGNGEADYMIVMRVTG